MVDEQVRQDEENSQANDNNNTRIMWMRGAARIQKQARHRWNCPHSGNETETKLKQNCFVSAKTATKRFSCFSQLQPVSAVHCKTAVYDDVNQTLVNKHGNHMRY